MTREPHIHSGRCRLLRDLAKFLTILTHNYIF
jgi:hypothetical protein